MPCQHLSRICDRDLIASLHRLAATERARGVEILQHLNEVERRRLHFELGHKSLFAYCVAELKFSESAAGRRIAAARALRAAPEIGPLLESGELNLVTVATAARLLRGPAKDTVLERIRGRSADDVKAVVAEYRPEETVRDRVRPVAVRVRIETPPSAKPTEESAKRDTPGGIPGETDATVAGHATPTPGNEPAPPRAPEPPPARIVRKHEIRFVAGAAFMAKLEETKALLSNRMAEITLEQVFDAAMEAYLDANCPRRRDRRRKQKTTDRREKRATGEKEGGAPGGSLPPVGVVSRTVPIAVRDRVMARDGGRCTWVGPSGRRCGATHHLEIDHVVPFACGGSHDPSNLRVLCRAHNRLAAEHAYGQDWMRRYARRE